MTSRAEQRRYAAAMGYDENGQPVERQRDFAAYEGASEPSSLTKYERDKERDWIREYGPAEAARRVNALVKGREAATQRAQEKARATPASLKAETTDDAGELLRQRGTGSAGSTVILEEEG